MTAAPRRVIRCHRHSAAVQAVVVEYWLYARCRWASGCSVYRVS